MFLRCIDFVSVWGRGLIVIVCPMGIVSVILKNDGNRISQIFSYTIEFTITFNLFSSIFQIFYTVIH